MIFYYEYLIENIREKYKKVGVEVENLSDYASTSGIKRSRLIQDGLDAVDLFQSANDARQNIRDLCSFMTKDIQGLLAFATLKVQDKLESSEDLSDDSGMKKVVQLVEITNRYLEYMEKLLDSSDQELIEFSKRNLGLFSLTYEFEKEFSFQLKSLQLYYFN